MKNTNLMEVISHEQPQFNLNEMLLFSCNSDILQKYISYLVDSNKLLKIEMNDLKIKFNRIENEEIFNEINLKLNSHELKIEQISNSSHSQKFMDIDQKISKLQEAVL